MMQCSSFKLSEYHIEHAACSRHYLQHQFDTFATEHSTSLPQPLNQDEDRQQRVQSVGPNGSEVGPFDLLLLISTG